MASGFLMSVMLLFSNILDVPSYDITVVTRNGPVSGSTMTSRMGKKIFAFRGIPYGKPPVGVLRFRRSEPVGGWTGVLDGTQEAGKCLQSNVLVPELQEGGEDCLYLNVYTKNLSPASPLLPVIVYLHGGSFLHGSNEAMLYGPQILLDREVILVAVNYRLGALGFLSLETEEAPGNLGLHDQFLALSWVRDNIAMFGGDPENVTLMGSSAGAMSAMSHLVSPISRGLFHRIIALSGTSSSTLMHKDRSPRLYALSLATRLGYSGHLTDLQRLLSFLQSQPASNIVEASRMFADWDYSNPMPWTPSLDSFSSKPFLPLSFTKAVSEGRVSRVPVMFGLCKDEGLIFTALFYKEKERWELLRRDWTNWAPLLLFRRERELTSSRDRELALDIARFYYGENTEVSSLPSNHKTLSQLTRMFSMSYFYSPAHQDSLVLAKAGFPVHVFILSHPPAFTLMDLFRLNFSQLSWMFTARALGYNPYPQQYGTSHTDDLNYLFPIEVPGFPPRVVTEDQKLVQIKLLDIVSSYAKYGKPSPKINRIWEPLQVHTGISRYLRVEPNCSMVTDTYLQRELNFWTKVRARAGLEDWKANKDLPRIFYDRIAIKRQPLSWF